MGAKRPLTGTSKVKKVKYELFLRGDFRQFLSKNVHIWDHFFPLLFPKDSESIKILDIWLREVGAERPLNGTSKVNRHTDGLTDTQTDRRTDRRTFWLIESIGPEGRCFENYLGSISRCDIGSQGVIPSWSRISSLKAGPYPSYTVNCSVWHWQNAYLDCFFLFFWGVTLGSQHVCSRQSFVPFTQRIDCVRGNKRTRQINYWEFQTSMYNTIL